MKRIFQHLSALFVMLSAANLWPLPAVRSILGVPFGQVCTIKAEFIQKPNTYYAQNMSHAEFYLKILEINGKRFFTPFTAEPVYEGIRAEIGRVYTFKAYETLHSEGLPQGWTAEAQQMNYTLLHKIVIKNP